jgi:tRNA pseudouridine55 synthase
MTGALIIDKPSGITSHDVVARMRRVAAMRRIGHTGTLDPFATGVLILCLGQATRLSRFLVGLPKEYIATVRLGFSTNTQDLTGEQITPLTSSKNVSLEGLEHLLSEFIGVQFQTPPMFSAKKVSGERLYKAAREGREIKRNAVEIMVYSIETIGELVDHPEGWRDFEIRVKCSAGTYVRTLAHDIGQRLGVGAHLAALRRTAVGHFDISRALSLDELERRGVAALTEEVISPSEMLSHLPQVVLDPERVRYVGHGQAVELIHSESQQLERDLPIRVLDRCGVLVAVGRRGEDQNSLKPVIVLSRQPSD